MRVRKAHEYRLHCRGSPAILNRTFVPWEGAGAWLQGPIARASGPAYGLALAPEATFEQRVAT
jgi:hypothetical protein